MRGSSEAPEVVPWIQGRVVLDGQTVVVDRWIETHTAVVLLDQRRAFKIRKAVDLGYIEHMTPERRREAALRELALGRRFSPQVYQGTWSLSGRGPLVLTRDSHKGEPVLAMARLPDELRADLVMRRNVSPDRLLQAVGWIAHIHGTRISMV